MGTEGPVQQAHGHGHHHQQMEDNPRLGVFYYIVHTVLLSLNLYTCRALFSENPNMGTMQLTFVRGVISTIIMFAWLNKGLKKALFHTVDRKSAGALAFRCTQGGLSVFISFMSVKYFPVSTVGIVCSLTPLFVCVMAYFLLGERMRIFDWAALVAVFVSVSLVILGAEGKQRETMGGNFWATAALIS